MSLSEYQYAAPPLLQGSEFYNNLRVGNVRHQDNRIQDLENPINNQDAATKSYVDSSISSPGGNNTNVQFNNGGNFDGDANFTWTTGTSTLFVPNITTTGKVTVITPTSSTDAANKSYVDTKAATAAGADTQIQFNNGGNFDGDANLTWSTGTGTLFVPNITTTGKVTVITPVDSTDATNKSYVDTTAATAAGLDTYVQYNNGGNFAGSSDFIFDGTDLTLSNTIFATNFQTTSDVRLKSNIENIYNPIEYLKKINGYTYDMYNEKKYGCLAQELENIDKLENIIKVNNNGYKTIDYIQLIPIIIESIKELSNKK